MNAIFDVVADDVLVKLRLKPWWESWRAYTYKASIAVIVLFSVYDKTKFNCLPIHDNPSDYTDAQSVAVDAFCGGQSISWYISRGDLIAFGMSIITYILSNYWIHLNGVYDKLTDLSTFGRSILEVNMSAEEMQNAAVLPITSSSNEDHKLLRRNVQILLKYREHFRISTAYTIRCLLVLVWTGICSAAALWVSIGDIRYPTTVTCQITDNILQLGLGNLSSSFVCVDKATTATAMLETIFAITLMLQFVSMIAALYCHTTAKIHDNHPSTANMDKDTSRGSYSRCGTTCSRKTTVMNLSDAGTFLIAMMGIDELQANKIQSFTRFVISSDDFHKKMREYSDEAIIEGDVEYFRILKKTIVESPKKVENSATDRPFEEVENSATDEPFEEAENTATDEFYEEVENTATVVLRDGDRKAEHKLEKGGYEEPPDADYQVHIFLDKVFKIVLCDSTDKSALHEVVCQTQDRQPNGGTTSESESTESKSALCKVFCQKQDRQPNGGTTSESTESKFETKATQEKKKFGKNLMKNHNWHLLFCCPLTFDEPKLLKNIKSDMLDKEGRSCLFYVLRRSSMNKLLSRFSLFNRLIKAISHKNKKFVHFDGKSMKPEEFFYENYPDKFRGKLPDFRLCESSGQEESVNECEEELKDLYDRYRTRRRPTELQNIKGKFYYQGRRYIFYDQKRTSLALSRIKLTQMKGNAVTEFAETAITRKHWEVLVALINTFIVVQKRGERPEIHELIGNDIFDLKESCHIVEIFKEALKRPRSRPYFVPTAAEHILSIMESGETKEAMIGHVNQAILQEIKDRLVRFL